MRIISLVPSWTETLIEAGANVVGRTRYCIHPHDNVKAIEAVGGTKSFDIEKIRALKPDLILLDREENTKAMGEMASSIAPTHVSHVTRVQDMPHELRALAVRISNPQLNDFAMRFDHVLAKPALVLHNDSFAELLKWQRRDGSVEGLQSPEFVYCIWKDPWMSAGRGTFISSMVERVGFDLTKMWPPVSMTSGDAELSISPSVNSGSTSVKYPTFDEREIPAGAWVLLSSEPYPFAKKPPLLQQENIALVDGESFSWFGIRALRFLESAHEKSI